MTGQITVASQALLDTKMQMMSFERTPRVCQSIGQLTKAWEEVNKALRSIGYLLEEPEPEAGQEGTFTNE